MKATHDHRAPRERCQCPDSDRFCRALLSLKTHAVTLLGCLVISLATPFSLLGQSASDGVADETARQIVCESLADRIVVKADNDIVAEFRGSGWPRPILYPINAPGGQSVVRNYPMVENVDGEAADHPHHQSLWFAHGDVNGLDFWSGKALIENKQLTAVGHTISVVNEWHGAISNDESGGVGNQSSIVVREHSQYRFAATGRFHEIEFTTRLTAGERAVVFGDTKEGTFAIRTCPQLRILDTNKTPTATAFNSEGDEGVAVWGKRARWVHYENAIGDETYGITVMDAPSNLRHPNYWHAREYGLIAANPFGLHDLGGHPENAGDVALAPGQSLSLRYGVTVWRGSATRGEIESRFQNFSAGR